MFSVQTELVLNVFWLNQLKKSSDKWITRFNRGIGNFILKGVKKRYPNEYKELIEPYGK